MLELKTTLLNIVKDIGDPISYQKVGRGSEFLSIFMV